MANQRRIYKIAERIRSTVALYLLRLSDPRFNLVTITAARVTSDLRLAKIYWSVIGDKDRIKEVGQAFESARGLFKKELSTDLGIKFVPELKFFYDDTLDVVDETRVLLDKIAKSNQSDDQEAVEE